MFYIYFFFEPTTENLFDNINPVKIKLATQFTRNKNFRSRLIL